MKTKSIIDMRLFSILAILLSCCINSVIASSRGLPDQNKIVIGEVYTQGSGDSTDHSITIVSVFHPLENTVPLF